ncbi:hypothetical protein LTS18_005658, partial [Coniosporium uncinatum]
RHGRWATAMLFFRRTFWLLQGLNARVALLMLEKLGMTYKPAWLVGLAGRKDRKDEKRTQTRRAARDDLGFWMLGEDGNLHLPADDNVDVETETRRLLEASQGPVPTNNQTETTIDDNLYNWWKHGGWWGQVDNSGDFQATPPNDDENEDDTTSMISMSTNNHDDENLDAWTDTESTSEGRRTPTQSNPYPRTSTAFSDHHHPAAPAAAELFNPTELADMLDPQTDADKQQAKILARHLRSSGGPMTRSRYRRTTDLERARVLSATAGQRSSSGGLLTMEEEERALEQFILSQREKKKAGDTTAGDGNGGGGGGTWDTGAGGMGAGGPSCVVCQSSPRTIMAWPCGCLSCCDECRVGLATRNFAACICCRTDVVAYSRLYVP